MLTHFNEQSIIDALPMGACIFSGPALIIQAVNEPMLAIWAKDPAVIGKSLYEAIPELKSQPIFERQMNEVYQTGQTFSDPNGTAMLLKGGQMQQAYFHYTFKPLRDAAGTIQGIINTAIDTTEQVKSRQQVTQGQHRFAQLVTTSPVGMCVINREQFTIEMANQPMLNIWSRTREQVIGKPLLQVFPEVLNQPFPQLLENVFATGEPLSLTEVPSDIRDFDGRLKRLYTNFTYQPQFDLEGKVEAITATVVDVTSMVKARQKIQESEELFRTIADGTNILIAVADDTSNGVFFNKAWTEVTGRPMPDLVRLGWLDRVHPDDREHVLNIYLGAFKERVPFTVEFRLLNKKGDYRWLLATGPPRFRADGSFAGYISACVDITEQKQDEQRKNDFISMVSHELKTPLTSMGGYLQILQSKAKKNEDTATLNMLDRANNQVKKMTTMINGFLNTARLESGKIHIDVQRFDMAVLMKEVEEEATATTANHHLIFAPVEETFVLADRDKIGQVVTNFISNAGKYSPTGTTIQIACVTRQGKACVSVKDEGMGVAPQDKEKLFDRFYRVQGAKMDSISGFGIGLYLCTEIVQRHGGEIGVDSELGKGSTFYFTLPVVG